MKLDLNGKVLGATGGQGKGPNRYGEAHYLALDTQGRHLRRRHAQLERAEAGQEQVTSDRRLGRVTLGG